ncbi:hypothetical protein [Companilactobacillus furfuricola]|uniref:hypothetical protein n=1 Tax=Companilactobacillus furfuricola TaxID=1462575 RepID=UPI000F79DD83|nr:hypothetical protein [Companilactobacillus furfuricola]
MKNILVLNGSSRTHRTTKQLIDSFTEGAEKSGNSVRKMKTDELKFSVALYSDDQGYKENPYNLHEVLSGSDVTARFS